MEPTLRKEFDYFLAHQNDLVRDYDGKFVVIKNCQVIGAYDSEPEAIAETQKTQELGTFLVQRVSPGSSAYRQSFHSLVAFS